MLMHTRGILVMIPASAMVLTGKQALDFSGGVSAEDNAGIGGYDRVMGPNGQAQYWAPTSRTPARCCCGTTTTPTWCPASGSRGAPPPRTRSTGTSGPRRTRRSPAPTCGRRRRVLARRTTRTGRSRSTSARCCGPSPTPTASRWSAGRAGAVAETVVVWDAAHRRHSRCACSGWSPGRWPGGGSCRPTDRSSWTLRDAVPAVRRARRRGPSTRRAGTGPLVVLANLSGFDGSPESMRHWQLEYGAEIGRAVTNFDGPIVFVVISRYHGGAFVVFSKRLNADHGDRRRGGLVRLGHRRRAGRGHGVRARGAAAAPSSDPRVAELPRGCRRRRTPPRPGHCAPGSHG